MLGETWGVNKTKKGGHFGRHPLYVACLGQKLSQSVISVPVIDGERSGRSVVYWWVSDYSLLSTFFIVW
jgi:hypothetical protein